MTHYECYHTGSLYGTRYRFESPGEAIPEHVHDRQLAHNIIVLGGCVEIRFGDGEIRRLCSGTVFDFDGQRAHCIVSVEPATSILNLQIHGPQGMLPAPPGEFEYRL